MSNLIQNLWSTVKTVVGKERAPRAELEFLPAALEVTETPPAPLGRIILWTIVAFFVIAVLWACFGKVDIVAVAQGKIVPGGGVKVIQPLEAGVVKQIHVESGQRVKPGDPLIQLDSTSTGADRERLEGELVSLELDRLRLKVLLENIEPGIENSEGKESGECPDSSKFCIPKFHSTLSPQVTAQQKALLEQRIDSQYQEYLARTETARNKILELRSELRAVNEKIEQLDQTIPLVTEREQAMEKMLASGVVPRAQWLEVEERRIEQVKEREIQKNNREKLRSAIAGAEQQLAALAAQTRGKWLGELNEVESRIGAIRQEVVKAAQRQTLQTLKAPVAGRVQQVAVHTIGGVVTPAQELMRVVPEGAGLEVDAWLQNKDIGFVHEGQPAEIKVETFPYTKYGVIDGEVINVSDDAVPNEDLGLVYVARVSMDKSTMQVNDKTVRLSPGMAVSVEVKIGKRRIIEYLLSPLLRYKEESIQER